MIYLYGVVLVNHSSVVKVLVDLILPDGMLDIVILYLFGPAVVKVVYLASYFPATLQVESFVNLGVTAFAQNA